MTPENLRLQKVGSRLRYVGNYPFLRNQIVEKISKEIYSSNKHKETGKKVLFWDCTIKGPIPEHGAIVEDKENPWRGVRIGCYAKDLELPMHVVKPSKNYTQGNLAA